MEESSAEKDERMIVCEVGQIDRFRIIESMLLEFKSFMLSKSSAKKVTKTAQWKREQKGNQWKS